MKVDVQCPFCGECYKRHAKESSKSIRCRFCGMSIFLRKSEKNDLTNWLTNHSTTMNALKN